MTRADSAKEQTTNDCFAPATGLLSHADVIARLQLLAVPAAASSICPLMNAAGRVLADPVIAPRPVPSTANAAVDGYAFGAEHLEAGSVCQLRVVGHVAAGDQAVPGTAPSGCAIRILTGASIPPGCDTVVMQEDVAVAPGLAAHGGNSVTLPAGWRPGSNVRPAGEDVTSGSVVVPAQRRLRAVDLAAIASTGAGTVTCYDPLPTAIASTGNELLEPGAPFAAGSVFDSNAALLADVARNAGAAPEHDGIWPDDGAFVRKRLRELAGTVPLIVTTGGASGSEADHVSAALADLGERSVWRIAVKPGRPLCIGRIGETVVVGLPGNTVAVAVCALIYLWPLIGGLAGGTWRQPARLPLRAGFDHPHRRIGRREFWRARRVTGPDGAVWVEKFARDGSGLISSLTFADGLIEIDEDVAAVARGDTVPFIPFADFGMAP